MKLVRFGNVGQEKPGLIDSKGAIRDLSAHVDDITGQTLGCSEIERLRSIDVMSLPMVEPATRLGSPIADVGKIVAIGLNYSDHAAEAGLKVPQEPIVFSKAVTSLSGPNDSVVLPRGSVSTDWEVELGVVIGRRAKYVDEAEALRYVAGYCIVNDVSERDFQTKRSGQWIKGKSHDTFCPTGPWLVTRDEVSNPQALQMRLDVNGQTMQNGNTKTMVYGVAYLVHYLSQFMTLMPGDLIPTGTPPGVGLGMKPEPVYLKAGDVMDVSIEGLGSQRQNVMPSM